MVLGRPTHRVGFAGTSERSYLSCNLQPEMRACNSITSAHEALVPFLVIFIQGSAGR